MIIKVVYRDGSWLVGKRTWLQSHDETRGCHHFKVLDGNGYFADVIGEEIAIHVSNPLYFVLNYSERKRKEGK